MEIRQGFYGETMKVIVGCEFSQVVTKAFRDKGHEAYSCDLLPTEGNPRWHFQEDILELLKRERFDLGIFHPPCTDLCSSGARWFAEKRKDGRQQESINFFMRLVLAPIEKIAVENPVGIMSTIYRKPDQIIQPWQFGHPESKATCLWLKNLPALIPTKICEPVWHENLTSKGKRTGKNHNRPQIRWENQTATGQNKLPPSADRWKLRSITYQGIAEAMAAQWSEITR